MASYCVNKNKQDTGEHEVHNYDCNNLPDPKNRIYLGTFNTCHGAIKEAKKHFTNVDGCKHCSPDCNTG